MRSGRSWEINKDNFATYAHYPLAGYHSAIEGNQMMNESGTMVYHLCSCETPKDEDLQDLGLQPIALRCNLELPTKLLA